MNVRQNLSEKQPQITKHLCHQKKKKLCVGMYKMNTFALFTSKVWGKNGIEVVEI